MSDVFADFKVLQAASSSKDFEATKLSGSRLDYIAKDQQNRPVFLLEDRDTGKFQPSLQLRYLHTEFQLTCRLRTGGKDVEGVYAIVTCTAEELELQELFIRSFDAARQQLAQGASTEEISRTVQRLAALFRAFSSPSKRSVNGLWAELFTLTRSGCVTSALKLWRANPFDRFDFSGTDRVVEVKATTGPLRVHEFSAEQLATPVQGNGYVISILLQPISGGTSLLDLISLIESSTLDDPTLREKLWSNVISDMGADFASGLERRFDSSFAERNLKIYQMRDIPRATGDHDPRITSIRFATDCSSVESSAEQPSIGGLAKVFCNSMRQS